MRISDWSSDVCSSDLQRRLGESALAGADRAGGGADRGIAEQPAERPAKGRHRRRVDAMTLHPEGEGDEKGELREKGERDPARAHVAPAGEPARPHDEDGQTPPHGNAYG